MINFRPVAQQRLIDILTPAVGVGSDPTEYVKTFSKYLFDVQIQNLPLLVVTIRTAEKLLPPEIGPNSYQKYTWTAHMYYLDMDVSTTDQYNVGADRRDRITGRIEKTLETSKFLADPITGNSLQTVDSDGRREYVYDTGIQAITFDDSGQPGNRSFTTELFFEIYTDRV